jgi:hypothetical protein
MVEVEVAVAVEVVATVEMLEVVGDSVVTAALPEAEVLEALQEEAMEALPQAEEVDTEAPLEAEVHQEEVTAVHPEAEEVDMEALLLAEVHLEEAGTEARLVLVETFMEVLLEEEALGDLPAVDTGAHQAATEI